MKSGQNHPLGKEKSQFYWLQSRSYVILLNQLLRTTSESVSTIKPNHWRGTFPRWKMRIAVAVETLRDSTSVLSGM